LIEYRSPYQATTLQGFSKVVNAENLGYYVVFARHYCLAEQHECHSIQPHFLGTVEALIDRWIIAQVREFNLVEFLEGGDPSEPLLNLNYARIRQWSGYILASSVSEYITERMKWWAGITASSS
jgi:hypothetical protein